MANIKSGFGNVNGLVDDSANPYIALNLTGNQTKRIFDIAVGYTLLAADIAGGKILFGGRLLVIGQTVSGAGFFNPSLTTLPSGFQGAQVYFDAPIFGEINNDGETFGSYGITKSFSFLNGLLIPKDVDAAVILTACFGNGLVPPLAAPANAFLNCNGLMGGSDKIFKNV